MVSMMMIMKTRARGSCRVRSGKLGGILLCGRTFPNTTFIFLSAVRFILARWGTHTHDYTIALQHWYTTKLDH